MVTGILIPLVCLYFYWLTKKEWKQRKAAWKNVVHVEEQARVIGKIQAIAQHREKFYVGLYLDVYAIELLHDGKMMKAFRKYPEGSEQPNFENLLFKEVTLLGRWSGDAFLINRILIKEK